MHRGLNPVISPYQSEFTLWKTKIKNLHKKGKLETERKTFVLYSEMLEMETPKRKNKGFLHGNLSFYSTYCIL